MCPFDKFDTETKTTSMARTTGYTCSAVARLLIEGRYKKRGISPPEFVGKEGNCFNYVASYLKERNVQYTVTEELIT